MTHHHSDTIEELAQELFQQQDGLKGLLELLLNAAMRGEVSEQLGAERHERNPQRQGWRNGAKPRKLKTRVGELALSVPQVRNCEPYHPSMFARWQHSERALLVACAEMYFQGVSTRRVRSQPGPIRRRSDHLVTGIGDVSNPPPTGAPALGSPLATANLTPTVTVGGAPAQVFFAGLAPFFVGLGQVNIQLPSQFDQTAALRTGAAQGATLPLVIAFRESRSQAVNLPIAGVTPSPGQIDVSPAGLDFGDVNVGSSANATLTIRNVGGGGLTVSSINIDNSQFAVTSPSVPFTVAPGGWWC